MRTRKKTLDGIEYEESSGNVFADLGLPNPEERMAKALLSIAVERAIEEKQLSQSAAAELPQCDQSDLSRVIRGDLSHFSMERLFRFLNALGMDVRIEVSPKSDEQPEARAGVRRLLRVYGVRAHCNPGNRGSTLDSLETPECQLRAKERARCSVRAGPSRSPVSATLAGAISNS
jgi:predicted XRE-type DNA-binding protein